MSKYILIYSDGTGQIGGMRPDQRLSNVYKMYRAMRPGPNSPIKPSEQFAFYDPGLGAGETTGITIRRIRNKLEAAVGTGIDENVIDCYEAIISSYNPGDKICIFGFSRGAYTARAVTNVLNLCGVPTKMPDGSPVPRHGAVLRKIATDGVKYVYNHGAGAKRSKFEAERKEKARRFRAKYASGGSGENESRKGNVQPVFVGVFDTVAALGSKQPNVIVYGALTTLIVLNIISLNSDWPFMVAATLLIAMGGMFGWLLFVLKNQLKYFSPDIDHPLRLTNPLHWPAIKKNGHWAVWRKTNYDRYLDADVKFARHALSLDENRADFSRVKWATSAEEEKTIGRSPEWLKQVWFPGCHSDIGGSYPETESRLSDIALSWMLDELRECVPEIQILNEKLVTSPDPLGLQHEERVLFTLGPFRKKWTQQVRPVEIGKLHSSVFTRLEAEAVPQMGEVKKYRPVALRDHKRVSEYYNSDEKLR